MKKKIQVIKPTQRHKKRYVLIEVSKDIDNYTEKEIFYLFLNSLYYLHGFVVANITNLVLLEANTSKKQILFRVNKEYLDCFLGSLLFVKNVGVVKVVTVKSTIKSFKN
jgi:RNase P/RNase MRP subunit POP5